MHRTTTGTLGRLRTDFRPKIGTGPVTTDDGKSLMHRFIDWIPRAIRPRFTAYFWVVAFCCGAVNMITWYFGLVDDRSARITLSVLTALALALEFFSVPTPWRGRKNILWVAAALVLALLLMTGTKLNINIIGTNAAIALVSLPLALLVWLLAGRQWLLSAAFLFALTVMMVYWLAALIQTDDSPLTLLLIVLFQPLPTVLLCGVVWAPVARWVLGAARRRSHRRISGPGFQAFAMGILFLPVALVAIVVPPALKFSDIWSAVSLTLVGVLLSAVVSDPLRRFLLEWTNLSLERHGRDW